MRVHVPVMSDLFSMEYCWLPLCTSRHRPLLYVTTELHTDSLKSHSTTFALGFEYFLLVTFVIM